MKKKSLMSYLVLLFAVLVTSLVLGCASDSDNDSDSAPQDDHSNTRSGATTLNLNNSLTGNIETGSDVDYFSVTASGPGTLTVYTSGSLDTAGVLEDSSGGELATDDDSGEGLNFRIVRSVTAGTYYIRVRSFGSATGGYTVHADFTASPTTNPPPPTTNPPTNPPTTSCVSRGLVAGGTITLSRFAASCSSGRVTCGLGSGSCSSECCCLDGGNLQCN